MPLCHSVGLLSNGLSEVMFVDYGNNECTPRETLKVIKDQFLTLPAQAILCSLAGNSRTIVERIEPGSEKTCFLHMRKQRRRPAAW